MLPFSLFYKSTQDFAIPYVGIITTPADYIQTDAFYVYKIFLFLV
jgi:hypothetical protein